MKLDEFDYLLPPEKIAQTAIEPRDSSKLMKLDKGTGEIHDYIFKDIIEHLGENDVLVINTTRVIKARLKGTLDGKQVEIFLHKQQQENIWDCLVYPGKKFKVGTKIVFEKGTTKLVATVLEITPKGRLIQFNTTDIPFGEALDIFGEIPLPPYIKEKSTDDERYQTVYNNEAGGSVAAPTAGLHFTPELLQNLKDKGVQIEEVLLHVGLGTFMNVESENIQDHMMHSEYISLTKEVADRLNNYKKSGKRIIAVGTTSVRVLESFSDTNGHLSHGSTDTNIFIYPGYEWKFVDSLITNFHLPKSTLLMLVSSLAGQENIKNAYRHAIDHDYRFFSFGDAMWIQ